MKNISLVILAVVVVAVAAVLFVRTRPSQNTQQMAQQVTQAPEAAQPTTATTEAKVHEITMTAKQWEFNPDTVTVKQGEKVKLTIKSTDVAHGIAIPQFNVNASLEPGKETTVEFVADKKGEFPFFCSVLCGRGHKDMTGNLVVE